MLVTRGVRRSLWIVTALLIALPATGLLFRNVLATHAATRVLAGQSLFCESVRVRVPVALPPVSIELAPMRCQSPAGPLQSIHFAAPLYVDLSGWHIERLHCASVTISLRAQPHSDVELNTLGDLTAIAGLDEPAIELMFDAAHMAAHPAPPFLAASVTVLRAGLPLAVLTDLRMMPLPEGMSLVARSMRARQISALGVASLRATASPERAQAVLQFESKLRVTVTAEHLQAPRPRVRFEVARGVKQ